MSTQLPEDHPTTSAPSAEDTRQGLALSVTALLFGLLQLVAAFRDASIGVERMGDALLGLALVILGVRRWIRRIDREHTANALAALCLAAGGVLLVIHLVRG